MSPRGEYDLRHCGGCIGDIDPWNPHLFGEIRIDVDRIEDQTKPVHSEARLIQPAAAERFIVSFRERPCVRMSPAPLPVVAPASVWQGGRQKLLQRSKL